MNQEIHDIIADMKGRCKENAIAEPNRKNYAFLRKIQCWLESSEAGRLAPTLVSSKNIETTIR